MGHIRHSTLSGSNGEGATSLDGHFAHVRPLRVPARHDGFDDIARSEAKGVTGGLGLRARKPVFIHQAHLPPLPPLRLDYERHHIPPAVEPLRRARTHTEGIEPMGLG